MLLHDLEDAKPQARRALLDSARDYMMKAIFECAMNKLKGNHKLTKNKNSNLHKYKNRLHALVNPEVNLKVNVNF